MDSLSPSATASTFVPSLGQDRDLSGTVVGEGLMRGLTTATAPSTSTPLARHTTVDYAPSRAPFGWTHNIGGLVGKQMIATLTKSEHTDVR